MSDNNQLDKERLAKVESIVHTLTQTVQSFIENQIKFNGDLLERYERTTKTNWGTIWSAIGVVAMILSAVSAAIYYPINNEQKHVNQRLIILEKRERENFKQRIRLDERMERVTDERYLKQR